MIDARDQLTEAFERGFSEGEASLLPPIRDLYWIQFFLIDYEQGGWLYNWSTCLERFDAAIPAMRRRGLRDLAEILSRVRALLQPVGRLCDVLEAKGQEMSWGEMLEIIDPENELDELDNRIQALPDYGLPDRW